MMTRKKLNNILALVLAAALAVGLLPIQASAATIRFVDVPDGQWYSESINRLAEAGVVSGVGQNKFEPGRSVANAEMVKMLVNAFFRSDFNTYEQANSSAMWAHFGTKTYWFSFMCYYAKQTGLLDGVNVDIDDYGSCYTYMSRYDMAMVLYNAAAKKGVTVSADAKAVAKAELMSIGHYYDIPEQYRDVVVTVYASKLINGKGEQGFCGNDNMTRAEACTVLIRLEDLLKNGGGSTTDPDPGPSEPTVPTVKDIVVTTKANATLTNVQGGPFHGTAHNIADNGNPTGYLANGKPINEANIAELLNKAKEIWPNGLAWSEATTNNNWYDNPGTVAKNMMLTNGIFASPNAGCSGFASMISDYLFGKGSNPCHTVTNFEDIRIGDVIVMLNTDKSVHHVVIVTGINQTGSRAGYVFTAEGNYGDVVSWPGTSGWDAAGPDDLAAYGSYVILSRWPSHDPGKTPTQPATPTEKDIVVTTTPNTSGHGANGTAHNVTDNGFPTGYLNNGKELNETNVKELIEKAKTIWPESTTWTSSDAYNNSSNNWYQNPSSIMQNALGQASLGTTRATSPYWGCGGLVSMLNDYIFGKTGNPVHRVTDFADVHPGDIVVQINADGSPHHVMMITDIVKTGGRAGAVFCVGNTTENTIGWPNTSSSWNAWQYDNLAAYGSVVIFSRWPSHDAGKTPAQPATPTEKDIVVTTTSATDSKGITGTAYRITDNGFPTGYLGNGKPINDANITELLEKAKTIWPDGMTWTSPGAAGNSWYSDLGSVAKSIPNLHGTGENYECSGFALMLSDYLFGKNNNPWKEVTNFAEVHVGDIIIQYEANGTARHVMTVIGINQTGSRAGYVFCADGNRDNTVNWAKTTSAWNAWGPTELAAYGSYKTYTRWPS